MKAALLAALLCAAHAHAEDSADIHVRAQWESHSALQAAELRWQLDAPLHSTLRGMFSARHQAGDGATALVNELSLDRALGPGYATIGKKVMSWDVGYAFRPIDVVQQEDRRALRPVALEGVPMLAWEVFDAERALTLVWSNPGRRRADQPRGDGSLALRLFRRQGARDEYAVLRVSDRNGLEGGAAFSHVAGEAVELHGSILWQQRHEEWVLMPRRAPLWKPSAGGGKAMAGMTWTTESKFSVLGEAWVDRSVRAGQQRNVLLRAAQTEGDVEAAADVLWMPNDGGRVVSAALTWKPSAWLLGVSWRHYGGSQGALVRMVPARSTAVATIERAF